MCASRIFPQNLGRTLTADAVQQGTQFADPLRVDAELEEMFKHATHGDPLEEGQDGNFDGRNLKITSANAVDTEFVVAHQLGRVPKGFEPVAVPKAGYRYLASLYSTKDADDTNLYMAVSAAGDASKTGFIRIY